MSFEISNIRAQVSSGRVYRLFNKNLILNKEIFSSTRLLFTNYYLHITYMHMVKEQLNKFIKPLEPQEVEWKIQGSKNGKTLVVPYVDNRAVMTRLDDAFGPEHWSTEFREIKDGFICRLTINGISKEDGANESTIEAKKGGISNAMKRAATQWGLGRELYNYPTVYIEGTHRFIPDKILERLFNMVKAYNEGILDKKVYIIK
jgi:hypothetical protein